MWREQPQFRRERDKSCSMRWGTLATAAGGVIASFVLAFLISDSFRAWLLDTEEPLSAADLATLRCELRQPSKKEAPRYRLAFERADLTYPYAISVHDYDGDGRPDLIAANADTSSMHVFRNEGGLKFTERVVPLPGAKVVEAHLWTDVDGDGRQDLVFVDNLLGAIHWLDKAERMHDIAPRGTFQRAYNVTAGDFNGDGRTDIAGTNFIGGELRVFLNPGANGEKWDFQAVDSPGADVRGVSAGDIDGDGDIDLAAAARLSNSLYWFENVGDGWRRHAISTAVHLPTRAHLVDLDRDGDLDLLVASGFFSTEEPDGIDRCTSGVIWFENRAPKAGWQRRQVRVPFVSGFNAAAGDINADGLPDVAAVAYGLEGRLAWFERPADPQGVWAMHTIADQFPFGVDVKIADLDGDGRQEIVASTIRGRKIRSGKIQVWSVP